MNTRKLQYQHIIIIFRLQITFINSQISINWIHRTKSDCKIDIKWWTNHCVSRQSQNLNDAYFKLLKSGGRGMRRGEGLRSVRSMDSSSACFHLKWAVKKRKVLICVTISRTILNPNQVQIASYLIQVGGGYIWPPFLYPVIGVWEGQKNTNG